MRFMLKMIINIKKQINHKPYNTHTNIPTGATEADSAVLLLTVVEFIAFASAVALDIGERSKKKEQLLTKKNKQKNQITKQKLTFCWSPSRFLTFSKRFIVFQWSLIDSMLFALVFACLRR